MIRLAPRHHCMFMPSENSTAPHIPWSSNKQPIISTHTPAHMHQESENLVVCHRRTARTKLTADVVTVDLSDHMACIALRDMDVVSALHHSIAATITPRSTIQAKTET